MKSGKNSKAVYIKMDARQNLHTELYRQLGFEDSPSREFWDKVIDIYDSDGAKITWQKAINLIRSDIITDYCIKNDVDPVLYLMENAYQQFLHSNLNDEELLPSFKREISKLVEILLDRADAEATDGVSKYSTLIDPFTCQIRRSLLHIAAECNQYDIAKHLVDRYPELLYATTQTTVANQDVFYPVEFALKNEHDHLSALLISSMDNSFVRSLLSVEDAGDFHSYKFKDFINNENMKETVAAFLDSFVDPCWPYIPKIDDEDLERRAWQDFPDVPIRYHFHYKYLDGDQQGYPPDHPQFDCTQFSPLHLLVVSAHNKKCIRHPVVRMLVRTKWQRFARRLLGLYGITYVAFIISLCVAGVLGASQYKKGPLKYETTAESVRLIFEIISIILTVVHIMIEVSTIFKEKWTNAQIIYKCRDLIGYFGIFVVVGLRIGDYKSQWTVASIVFMINIIGVFRFAYLWETGGLYTNTFVRIMSSDLPKFLAVFAVVFLQYTGGLYFAMTATDGVDLAGGLTGIILKEFRAVTEMNPFDDSYDSYRIFVVILILLNMLSVIVVLMNVLIAQLNNRYADAQKEARQQFDLDKALNVVRMETSRFKRFNLRWKYYTEGAYVNDTSLVQEILKDWHRVKR